MKYDLHIHTRWSDGANSPHDMARAAEKQNLQLIAISDHYSANPIKRSSLRGNLDRYFEDIRETHKNSSVEILPAIEIDTLSISSFDNLLEVDSKASFILFEYVIDSVGMSLSGRRDDSLLVLSEVYEFATRVKVPVGLAHPHLELLTKQEFDIFRKKIKSSEIFLELNTHYKNYKNHRFEETLAEGIRFTVGSDSHRRDFVGNLSHAITWIQKRGIPRNFPSNIVEES